MEPLLDPDLGRLTLTVLGLLLSAVVALYNQRPPNAERAVKRTNGHSIKRSTDEFYVPIGLVYSAKDTEVRLTVLERRLDALEIHHREQMAAQRDEIKEIHNRLDRLETKLDTKIDAINGAIQQILLKLNSK